MHDTRRFHHETGKSFDKIFKNIKLALDNNITISVRFNADANNFNEIKKIEKLFQDAGYYDTNKFSLTPALLRGEESGISINSSLMGIDHLDVAYTRVDISCITIGF